MNERWSTMAEIDLLAGRVLSWVFPIAFGLASFGAIETGWEGKVALAAAWMAVNARNEQKIRRRVLAGVE